MPSAPVQETDSDSDFTSYCQPSTPFKNYPPPQPQPPQPPQPQNSTRSNFNEACIYLNHELASLGFPSPLNFAALTSRSDDSDSPELNDVMNCVFALVQQRQKDSDYKTETEERIARLQNEASVASDVIAKLKHRLESTEREVDGLYSKLSSTELSLKEQEKANRSLRDEIKYVKFNMQSAKSQYAHELRKREAEHGRLKDRLQKSINDKLKCSKVGLKMISPLSNGSTGISSARPRNKDEEMYRMVLSNYESREKEVMVENELLRSALSELYQTAKCCIRDARVKENGTGDSEDGEGLSASSGSRIDGSEEKYTVTVPKLHMPFSAVQQSVVDEVRELLADLALEWGNRPALQAARDKQRSEAKESELIESMNNKLKEYEAVMFKMLGVLDLAADQHQPTLTTCNCKQKKKRRRRGNVELGSEEGSEEEEEEEWTESELQSERQVIRQLRRELDEERRRFTEAAIRMGKERVALQDEKETWEEQKREFHTKLMLDQLPGTPITKIPRSRNPTHDTRTPSTVLGSQHRGPRMIHPDVTPTRTLSTRNSQRREEFSREEEVKGREETWNSEFKPSLGRGQGSTPHGWKRDAEVTFGSPLAIVVESDTLASNRTVGKYVERRSDVGRRRREGEKENWAPSGEGRGVGRAKS